MIKFKHVPGVGYFYRIREGRWQGCSSESTYANLDTFSAVGDVVPVIMPVGDRMDQYQTVVRLAELCRAENGDVAVDVQVLIRALRALEAERRR